MYLLDTDTIIYALKGNADVLKQFDNHLNSPMGLSVITYGELIYGAMKSTHRSENLAKVRRLSEIYPIFDVTKGVVETLGELKADLERAGQKLDDFDLLIAATALMLGYCLVTNNERHFERVKGLAVENWSRKN